MRPRYLLSLCCVPLLVWAGRGEHVRDKYWSFEYDHTFKKYAKHYFGPAMDWRWFKAQGIAESGLQADARSSAGAIGIMQIMPATFAEIREQNPHFVDIREPKWNIAAGIFYDRKLYKRWQKQMPKPERLDFTFASYNAGHTAIKRALKKASNEAGEIDSWLQVAPYSPPETRHYVRRIKGLMGSE